MFGIYISFQTITNWVYILKDGELKLIRLKLCKLSVKPYFCVQFGIKQPKMAL
jgi:hypothetical protein